MYRVSSVQWAVCVRWAVWVSAAADGVKVIREILRKPDSRIYILFFVLFVHIVCLFVYIHICLFFSV